LRYFLGYYLVESSELLIFGINKVLNQEDRVQRGNNQNSSLSFNSLINKARSFLFGHLELEEKVLSGVKEESPVDSRLSFYLKVDCKLSSSKALCGN